VSYSLKRLNKKPVRRTTTPPEDYEHQTTFLHLDSSITSPRRYEIESTILCSQEVTPRALMKRIVLGITPL